MLKDGRQPSGSPLRWSILVGALLLLGLVTGPGHAQSGPETIRIDTDLVSIDVNIRRERATGRPAVATGPDLPRLTAEDFIVREDGVRQQVVGFAATEVPFNLVLLIDTSGSTREDLDLIRRAARRPIRPQANGRKRPVRAAPSWCEVSNAKWVTPKLR